MTGSVQAVQVGTIKICTLTSISASTKATRFQPYCLTSLVSSSHHYLHLHLHILLPIFLLLLLLLQRTFLASISPSLWDGGLCEPILSLNPPEPQHHSSCGFPTTFANLFPPQVSAIALVSRPSSCSSFGPEVQRNLGYSLPLFNCLLESVNWPENHHG